MPDWTEPFARTIDAAKKDAVSSTLDRGRLERGSSCAEIRGKAVQQLKQESGKGPFTGGVKLPLALAELGFIDEYEFVVHPRLGAMGRAVAGLSKHIDLQLIEPAGVRLGGGGDGYEPEGSHSF